MANQPQYVTVGPKQWEIIAEDVLECNIIALNTQHQYTYTYRLSSGGLSDPNSVTIPISPQAKGRHAEFASDEICMVWVYNPSNETVGFYVASQ